MKYSIVIPTFNSVKYLEKSVSSVLNQNFDDFELIISDNYSNDGTRKYVESLDSSHIKYIQPPNFLSIEKHWEFALSHAQGEWVTLVGSDDGLMPYFFNISEVLTKIAAKKNIYAIGSERAYYFWDGCQSVYGDVSISCASHPSYTVRNSFLYFLDMCLGKDTGFITVPHGYTSSLLHKNLLQKIKTANNGKLIMSLSPDANLACSVLCCSEKYLHSYAPLGIVGSSAKSTGVQVSKGLVTLANVESTTKWDERMKNGDMFIDVFRSYFYESMLNSSILQEGNIKSNFIRKKVFRALIFYNIYLSIMKMDGEKKKINLEILTAILPKNNLSFDSLMTIGSMLAPIFHFMLNKVKKVENKIFKKNIFDSSDDPASMFFFSIYEPHSKATCTCLMEVWKKIQILTSKKV